MIQESVAGGPKKVLLAVYVCCTVFGCGRIHNLLMLHKYVFENVPYTHTQTHTQIDRYTDNVLMSTEMYGS